MEERLNTRKRIRSDAHNLAEYVVKTTIEYKEELEQLEKDNKYLTRKNKYMKTDIYKKNEIIEILEEELERKANRINSLIASIGESKICYICAHSLCDPNLCVYCQKWVCECCRGWCSHNDDERSCIVQICSECSIENNKCPEHCDFKNIELMNYYKENRYKRDYDNNSDESDESIESSSN